MFVFLTLKKMLFICTLTAVIFMTGCTATTRDISTDDTIHYDESYDFSDKQVIVSTLVSSLVNRPPLVSREDRPVLN